MSRATLGRARCTILQKGCAPGSSPRAIQTGVLMPAMNLNDADLDKLVAYLTTLK
jgi:hypothetical protein